MRPIVMVDYGGKMPQLQEHLCALLKLIQKENSTFFEHLRVMVIEDMIYLVNLQELAEYVGWILSSEATLLFVDLEQDPPKMITNPHETSVAMELLSIQRLFSSVFTHSGINNDFLDSQRDNGMSGAECNASEFHEVQLNQLVDMSFCMKDCNITIPTLNGWLLGYPVVYLFGKDHISDAICNLSTKFLHLFKIVVERNGICGNASPAEELMSFSVPYDLSMDGLKEPWAEAFLLRMKAKWERCKQAWRSLKMEVIESYPQAIVL
ncbi:hypothetical protein Dimus_022534 [Dionaea muscipula]